MSRADRGADARPSPDSAPTSGRTAPAWFAPAQPWISLVVRLGLAAIMAWAAIPKLSDLPASQRAVAAYQLFPAALNNLIGVGLPILELVLAILFATGLLTRYAGAIFGIMLVLFIAGIIQSWVRGLNIDCGCFGGGGALPEGTDAKYLQEIFRDLGFFIMAAWVFVWPRSRFSLDSALGLDPVPVSTDKD